MADRRVASGKAVRTRLVVRRVLHIEYIHVSTINIVHTNSVEIGTDPSLLPTLKTTPYFLFTGFVSTQRNTTQHITMPKIHLICTKYTKVSN